MKLRKRRRILKRQQFKVRVFFNFRLSCGFFCSWQSRNKVVLFWSSCFMSLYADMFVDIRDKPTSKRATRI